MPSSKIAAITDEFGDFQTPDDLAAEACRLIASRGIRPASLLEPTCGIGNFLMAAIKRFPELTTVVGVDVNPQYVARVKERLASHGSALDVKIIQSSFFELEWADILRDLPEPIVVVGNPPWVTNSSLATIGSENFPSKSNFQRLKGLDAVTGKSNFDISESMLITLLEVLAGRDATFAMLCKSAVARRVLLHVWNADIGLIDCEIHTIDTAASFGAAAHACLLYCRLSQGRQNRECRVYQRLGDIEQAATVGYRDGALVANVAAYEHTKHLVGEDRYQWRSGVKHDCARVMELQREGEFYRNGFSQQLDLEPDYLYPMLKSSDLAKGCGIEPSRFMIVTQKAVGDDTSTISKLAPKTWEYLRAQGESLDRRASSIYRNRPRFSVFGVGEYTFAPWKVAISGFYKSLNFVVVGPFADKSVVLDDTAYFLPCQSEPEARCIASLLNARRAREFFSAFVFWDAKRPITIDLLSRLSLTAIARELGTENVLATFR